MSGCGRLLALALCCAAAAAAQEPGTERAARGWHGPFWVSAGTNGFTGGNINTVAVIGPHCISAQYEHYKSWELFDKPPDVHHRFNVAYGRRASGGGIMAIGSVGVCWVDETTYEMVNSDFVSRWVERNSGHGGITIKGQVLLRTRHLGIGPGIVASGAGGRSFIGLYLDLAVGELK